MNRSARPLHDVLQRIVAAKREEVAALRRRSRELRAAAESAPAARGFGAALSAGDLVAVIAEYKRRSPSAGVIRDGMAVEEVVGAYEAGGARALSILTDAQFFGGSLGDLGAARSASELPVLRKDFVLDEVQIWEARCAGADAVLLIVRILDDAELRGLLALAQAVGVDALVEAHDEGDLERALAAGAGIVGINNRDLSTFEVDLGRTEALAGGVPSDIVLVGESGIGGPDDVSRLAAAGVHAVLVGESVMRSGNPRVSVAALALAARRSPRSGAHGRAIGSAGGAD